ncbi:hypothetical protein [Paractinoplanes hotanensis]|nr:hypothetical protein [Actinoplanes hotanensis]
MFGDDTLNSALERIGDWERSIADRAEQARLGAAGIGSVSDRAKP